MQSFQKLSVINSPSVEHALQDCVFVNSETVLTRKNDLCVVADGYRRLLLPVKNSSKVPARTVSMSCKQRQSVIAALSDTLYFTIADQKVNGFPALNELPKVSKIECQITNLRRSGTGVSDVNKLVETFKDRFKNHPLNLDHVIPIKVVNKIYLIRINHLEGENCALMNDDCEVIST